MNCRDAEARIHIDSCRFYPNTSTSLIQPYCFSMQCFGHIFQKAAYEERLRRKAELQKKASKSATFGASLRGELDKQKEMGSKTKEERRNALCEELGRGC